MEQEQKGQKRILYTYGLPIILGTILLIAASYAWLSLTLSGTKTNVLKAGTLSLVLDDATSKGISLTKTSPISDEEGMAGNPYHFTLTNDGTIDSSYIIYLDDMALETGESRIRDIEIKYHLAKDNLSLPSKLLSTTGENPNRVLESGTISPGDTYTYDLRMWLDENASNEAMGKTFRGMIRIEAIQIVEKTT